jgi:cystathionine beta-lyase/cystathionine gamma-synthase
MPNKWGFSTAAVHAGQVRDAKYGSILTPIYMEDAFINPNPEEDKILDPLSGEEYIYSRYGNPTLTTVEKVMADLEGAEAGLLFSSGMSAISTTLLTLTGPGDHLISLRELYGQTFSFLRKDLPKHGVSVTFLPVDELTKVKDHLRPNTKAVYLESITNPTLRVPDIQTISSSLRGTGVKIIVDATFASPYNQNPLSLGADIVLHSATKYLNGHNDLIAGAVAGDLDTIKIIRDARTRMGATPTPLDAFLLGRGIKTLALRVERQNSSAQRIARFLESELSAYLNRVHYPGLESHHDYAVAKRVLRGYGGVVSFELKGGDATAKKFAGSLELAAKAPSLGGVHSLVTVPRETSHHPRTGITEEELRNMGVNPGLVRLSVGIEDLEDLLFDLEKSIKATVHS